MSLPILGSSLLYHAPVSVITPGSTTYSASGNYNFTVPAHNTLVVKVWGPGGSGGSARPELAPPYISDFGGAAGGNSSWNVATLVAYSGNGGQGPRIYSIHGVAAGGVGGIATGGTVNLSGGSGFPGGVPTGSLPGAGGTGANGGTSGMPPGGGGSGGSVGSQTLYSGAAGGGGGGYCERTYTIGTYAIGQIVSIVVGVGGICPDPGNDWPLGGTGATGKVQVSWT